MTKREEGPSDELEPTDTPIAFSIITPVYKTPIPHLKACISSVWKQSYPHWEHILVDDGSASPEIDAVLALAAARDRRIRVFKRPVNGGIIAASNDALEQATGAWVGFLDHDDMLEPDALETMAQAIADDPEAVLAYSDWTRITEDGKVVDTFKKPAWSPERLAGNMYLIHFTVMRLDRVREVGGFRPGYEGSQDHDLALRVTEGGQHVVQVQRSLYLWRMIPTSTAMDPDSKPYARINGVRACQDHFDRIGRKATVSESKYPGLYVIEREPAEGSLVSIIIPTRGTRATTLGRSSAPLVVNAVKSMLAEPSMVPVEIVVVYDEGPRLEYLTELGEIVGDRLVLVPYRKPFNFSEKVNMGAVHASGDILVFANDDLEITSSRWLDQMTALAQEPEVGAVGALLYFEDGSLQHAGHTFIGGNATHAYFKVAGNDVGYFGDLLLEHEVAGVTAALLACRAEVFTEVGGFSMHFPSNYNDVDFNLKLRRAGYRVVLSPRITAWHFESKTRDASVKPDEIKRIQARWLPDMIADPYLRVPT